MRLGQIGAEVQDAARLRFEIRKVIQARRARRLCWRPQFDLARRRHVTVVIGVNQIQDVALLLGRQNRTLLVNPMIEVRAGCFKIRPVPGIVINAISQYEIVQFEDGLLQMVGDLKALEFHQAEFVPQFTAALP